MRKQGYSRRPTASRSTVGAREAVAGTVIVGAVAAAALGAAVLRGNQAVEGHAVAAGSSTSSEKLEPIPDFDTQMGYKTLVLSQNIHELYYNSPNSNTYPSQEGILHRAEFPMNNGVTTYFEQRSTIISDPQTVNHIMIGQADPEKNKDQFKLTLDKNEDGNWAVECIDNDNALTINGDEISSGDETINDLGQAQHAMLAITDKSEEIIGTIMGDPTGNPVADPVPGICEQFMPE